MKRLVILSLLLGLLALPATAMAGVWMAFFPPSAEFVYSIQDAGSTDGVNHSLLGMHLDKLNLYFVKLSPAGVPVGPGGFAFVYGELAGVQQIGPNLYRVFWNVSMSQGGYSPYQPAGQISVDFNI